MQRLWLPVLIVLFTVFGGLAATEDLSVSYDRATALTKQGEYKEALKIWDQIIGSIPGSLRHIAYSDMGVCYRNLGEYDKALKAYSQSLKLASGNAREKTALNYVNLLLETGNYTRALAVLREVTTPSLVPYRLIDEANAIFRSDENGSGKALALLDSCLGMPNVSDDLRAVALQSKGFINYEEKNYADALANFDEAMRGRDKDNAYYQTLGNASLLKARLEDYPAAKSGIGAVTDYFRPARNLDYRIGMIKAGEIYLLAGEPGRSKEYFKEFFNLEKSALVASLPSLSPDMRLGLWRKEKDLLSKCFMLEDIDPDFLLEVALFRRETSLTGHKDVASLTRALNISPREIRSSLKNDEAALEIISYFDINNVENYAALLTTGKGKTQFIPLPAADEFTSKGGYCKSVLNAIKSERENDINRLYSDIELGDRLWQPVISRLPASVRKIYFTPDGIFNLWGIENMPFQGKENYNIFRLTSLRNLVDRKNSRQARLSDGSKLIIGGLDYNAESADEDRPENPDRTAGNLLRERVSTDKIFDYLKGTLLETEAIAGITGREAWHEMSETKMKMLFGRYETVHIATHGYSLVLGVERHKGLQPDNSSYDNSLNLSGLALTGANVPTSEDSEDGILSAREICDLDLSNVEFVILSACQTAKGSVVDEGPAGLVRSLKNAGVNTIIATLWSVNDESTMQFMIYFYEALNGGKSKYEAFETAKERLRSEPVIKKKYRFSPATMTRSKKPTEYEVKYDKPFYWAPFILIDAIN